MKNVLLFGVKQVISVSVAQDHAFARAVVLFMIQMEL